MAGLCFEIGFSCSERKHNHRGPDSHILSLLRTRIRRTVFSTKAIQGRSALARIGSGPGMKVPTEMAALDGFARDNSHNADDNFPLSKQDFRVE